MYNVSCFRFHKLTIICLGSIMSNWNFFTNHAHVIFVIAIEPQMTVRDIALKVGITERAVLRIISELAEDKLISIEKSGRSNIYTVNLKYHFRHDIERDCTVGDIIALLKSV